MGIHSVPIADTVAAIDRLKQMPLLQAQYRAAVDLLNRSEREAFLNVVDLGWLFAERWKMGQASDPRAVLSPDDVRLLRTALEPEYRRTCRFAKHLVEDFSAEDRASFLARESAAGYVITLTHLRSILPLVSSHRLQFLELFYQLSPTPAQLSKLILQSIPHCKAPSRTPADEKAEWLAQLGLDVEPEEVVARREIEERPDLLSRYREAIERVNQIFNTTLRDHIDLGRIGLAVKTDASLRHGPKGRIRATSAVKMLAAALGMHYEVFNNSLKLVETFTATELEMFCTRRSDTDLPITLGHLHWIARFDLQEKRNQLVELFYRESVSRKTIW